MTLLDVQHVQKVYQTRFGAAEVTALKDINFSVEEGEYVAVMGESGSGKTTLLNILATLDRPTGGSVLLNGEDIQKISSKVLTEFRRDHLGFVFQDFNLLETILMVTHSTVAASRAKRVLFIKDGLIYNQLYRGDRSDQQMFELISETLTVMANRGEAHV